MRRPAEIFKFVLIFTSLLALSTQAQSRVAEVEEREAQRWLRKIPHAAQTLNYLGTFIYQQGSRSRTSRITHVVQGKNSLEKLEVLDGKPREYVRKNEEIVYYAPDEKAVLVEQRVMRDGFPAILAGNVSDLEAYYEVRLGGMSRMAGYDCQVLELEPRDKFRYGYRLWIEKSSGLLLQIQTVAEGRVLEQIGFTQLALGNISPHLVRPSFADVSNWRVEKSKLQHVEVPDLSLGFLPPGFKKTAAVKRYLTQTGADTVGTGATSAAREVVQLVFSDGLAAISVFIEPGSHSGTEGSIQQGAVNLIGKRLGDFWLTIVGEVPVAAVKQVANSVEFKSHK